MKKNIAVFILIFIIPLSLIAEESFVIKHFQVDINVKENNSYDITEVIDVEFSRKQHGICRTLPRRFDDAWVKISNISIPNFEYSKDVSRNDIKILIGSDDKYVSGKQRYTISYTYDVGSDELSDMDEFNHNIIGVDWGTSIEAVDFTVHMPKAFNPEKVNCTSGRLGSTDNSKVEWKVSGNTITGKSLAPLKPHQALTLALPLPEAYWVGAVRHTGHDSNFFKIFGYPFYAFCLLLLFLLWRKFGKDEKIFPTIQFKAPEGLNPAEIGYIVDGKVDDFDVTSLIIYWADAGYLELEEREKENSSKTELVITKLRELPASAKSYERLVFDKFFELGNGYQVTTSQLTFYFSSTVEEAKKKIESSFSQSEEHKIFEQHDKVLLSAKIIAVLPCAIAMIEGLFFQGFLYWIIGCGLSFSVMSLSRIYGTEKTVSRKPSKKKLIFYRIAMFFVFLLTWGLGYSEGSISIFKMFVATMSTLVGGRLVAVMTKRTKYGDDILGKIIGFKNFIESAEKDRLETLFEQNPSYFYNVLPYAIVMGLSKKWAKHFENLSLEPPNWYKGASYGTFTALAFTKVLDSGLNKLDSAMTSNTSSGSSGSSGSSSSGGFSGGGSGGGGGGSW